MKEIDGQRVVYDLIQENPELKEILVNMGFKPLNNDKMLNTVGRMMSLNNGAKQINLTHDELAEELSKNGFELKA